MLTFHSYFHPVYDLGGKTNYRLPPHFLRPVISALFCSRKGHNFEGWGVADGTWGDETAYHVCSRCAVRRFEGIATQERFEKVLAHERARMEVILAEGAGA